MGSFAGSPFERRVLTAVRRIPPGQVATYGDVAAAAGRPRAARAVGTIMRQCSGRDVPCHRVIAAGGRLGGYGGNEGLKRALLRAEGLMITGTRVRNFAACRWRPRSGAPSVPSKKGARGRKFAPRRTSAENQDVPNDVNPC